MTAQDLDAQTAALETEESELRDRLRSLEDRLHSDLRRDPRANARAIDSVEREIRRIVLRLVEIDRDRIEIRLAGGH